MTKPQITRFVAHLRPSISEYSAECYTQWLQWFSAWANGRPVTTELISRWMNHMTLEKQVKSKTIKLYLQTINRFYAWAMVEKLVAVNPVDRQRLPRLAVCAKPEKRTWEVEDYRKILACCRQYDEQDWHDLLVVGYNTGLRLGDAASLPWSAIDWEKETLALMPAKTRRMGKTVLIPMTPELFAALDRRRQQPDDRYPELCLERVFPGFYLSYKEWKHRKLQRNFAYRCARAGVPPIGFHAMRHTFVSALANADVNYGVISSMTGQSIKQIQDYHHVSLEAQRKAISKIL